MVGDPHSGSTPLHHEAVELLVVAGADVEARDDDGRTPLHTASRAEEIAVLVTAGANLEARDNDGLTPLHTHFAPTRSRHW